MNTLQDMLQLVTEELEQNLSSEIDNQAVPLHHFSRRYQKRKQHILRVQCREPFISAVQWRLLIIVISFLALLTCGMIYVKNI